MATLLITSYKGSKWLNESLPKWCKGNFEICLVIDGCTENYIIPDKVRVIRMSENVGHYACLNEALRTMPENEKICVFGADDWIEPEILAKYFASVKGGEILRMKFYNDNGKGHGWAFGAIVTTMQVFKTLNGYKEHRVAMDKDLVERAKRFGIVVKMPNFEPFVRHVHPDSLEHSKETGMKSEYRNKVKQDKNEFGNLHFMNTISKKWMWNPQYANKGISFVWGGIVINETNLTDGVAEQVAQSSARKHLVVLNPDWDESKPIEKKKESEESGTTLSQSQEDTKDLPSSEKQPKKRVSRSKKSTALTDTASQETQAMEE